MTKLLIFDLDGTLINSVYDLAHAANTIFRKYGFPEHKVEDFNQFVGSGIYKMLQRALPSEVRETELVEQIKDDFLEYYQKNICVYTRPYKGILELLAALKSKGILLAVASNKFQKGTETLVHNLFGDDTFSVVLGQRENVPIKPDPAIVHEILEATNVNTANVLYVGDSDVDMFTAKNAGVRSIGVTWGLRSKTELETSGATYIVDKATEILNLILLN